MRESGVDPVATRQTLRTEMMKQSVIQQEVDRKIFFGLTMDELKKYFRGASGQVSQTGERDDLRDISEFGR